MQIERIRRSDLPSSANVYLPKVLYLFFFINFMSFSFSLTDSSEMTGNGSENVNFKFVVFFFKKKRFDSETLKNASMQMTIR